MIRRVLIEGFKRFDHVEFVLPGHIVVAGPNNSGKTTLLQAIAAWSLALTRWKELNDFQKHRGGYRWAPLARQAFSPVPLRSFDLLWRNRVWDAQMRIAVTTGSTAITGAGFQRWRWRRYEIESYLVHPGALARFVTRTVGESGSAQHVADLRAYLTANLPPAVVERPLDNHPYLNSTKARTEILPPALAAAGLPGLPYTRYHEIAAFMEPDEVHPDVREALDTIVRAFRR